MRWQVFVDALNHKLKAGHVLNNIKAQERCESAFVSCILIEPDVGVYLPKWLDEQNRVKECKSNAKAKHLKDLGNKEFEAKNYASSVRLYTKSAQYAQSGSEDLSIAIANRSASLFYMDKYEECLKDIELAEILEYPRKLRHKLHLRAAQCYLKLKKKKSTEAALSQVRESVNTCEDISESKRANIEKQITLLNLATSNIPSTKEDDEIPHKLDAKTILPDVAFGSNSNFAFASAGLSLANSPDRGRYVVANRDIKRGQVLFVEKPFASVLLDHEKNSTVCRHCYRPYGDVPVPCRTCLDGLYCSIKCWNDAWSQYHQWECPASQMGLNQEIGIAHLALKMLLVSSTTSDVDRFNEVQKLVTNMDKLSAEDILVYGITATMLMMYLCKYTDFFEVVDVKKSLRDKFADASLCFDSDIASTEHLFVSSLLLRHMLQLICNGHAITGLNLIASENDKVATEKQERIATGIFPSASMMNHSCDPNIINSFSGDYLIVKATKDIPAGGEVLNCYGPHFRRMSREERQEILKNQYCFTCQCEPCTSPEFQYFLERFKAFKCPECSGALNSFRSYSMHCLDCGATPAISYALEIREAQDLFESAQASLELERSAEALDKLKRCLSIRRNVLYKRHEDITITLDFIGKVYAMLGRWFDSISYLEHSIVGVEERFGSDSIEVANELNKITDICFQYLREETNTATKRYKNVFKKTRRFLDRAKEIMQLNYGSWNDGFQEIDEKREQLNIMSKNFNI